MTTEGKLPVVSGSYAGSSSGRVGSLDSSSTFNYESESEPVISSFPRGLDEKGEEKRIEKDVSILKKLKELKLDEENYEILGGFAIYRGKIKNYAKVRENFEKKVEEKLKVRKEEVKEVAAHIADFVNLGGTSGTRTNVVKVKEVSYKLDELTKLLEIERRVGSNFQNVSREEPTIASVGAAYADHTRETLKKFPVFSKIKELGDLGFTNSFYCTNLKPLDYRRIFYYLLEFEFKWDTARTGGRKPTRFSERMFFYCTLVLSFPNDFFEKVRRDFSINHGLTN